MRQLMTRIPLSDEAKAAGISGLLSMELRQLMRHGGSKESL